MLRRSLFCLLCLCLCFAQAKALNRAASSEEAQRFSRSKTYLVLSGDNMILDAYLKEAMTEVWKMTPFEITDLQGFSRLKKDTTASFLLTTTETFANKSSAEYIYLNLLLGEKSAQKIGDLPEIAGIPFSSVNQEKDPKYYLVPSLLKFLQQHARQIQQKSVWEFFRLDFDKRLNYYNRFNKDLKDKTLYIDAADIDPKVSGESLLLYFGKRLVHASEKELAQISRTNSDTVLIAYSILSFNLVISPSSGKLLYFSGAPGRATQAFVDKDFKVIYQNMRERKNFY